MNNCMIKKILFLVFLSCSMGAFSQKIAIKNNLMYDALKTPNLSFEFSVGWKWTFDTQVGMNFFFYTKDVTSSRYKTKKFSHWLVQPEARYWLCEKFNGHFFGLHAHYADYNVGGLKFLSKNMENHRYQGNLYGAGLSYGYQWLLSDRWSMEAVLGIGWAHLDYDKYPCATCGTVLKSDTKDYFGVTKAAISIIYFIK